MQKPKKKKIIFTVICVLIALYGIHFFRCGLYYVFSSDWERECLGESFPEILIPCDPIDAVRLIPLYSQVDNAMRSTECTSSEEAEQKYGKLYRYTFHDGKTASESHTLLFLTGNVKGDTAYLWISYRQRGYDENGDNTRGSGGGGFLEFIDLIPVRISAEKQNGEWVVTGIREAP